MPIYQSEYENRYGEVWVFAYDSCTDTSTVKGSDVDWQSYVVTQGQAQGVILTQDEQAWLTSCWNDAIKERLRASGSGLPTCRADVSERLIADERVHPHS